MRSLNEFMKLFPGVRPRKASTFILNGGVLAEAARNDIHIHRTWTHDKFLVGPDAASAITAAYLAGKLPMDRGRAVQPVTFLDKYVESARTQLAARKRREACIADPSLVSEDDLCDAFLIDAVFWRDSKPRASMVLAGITVNKSVSRYRTNSGKNHSNEVTFHWVGSDGVARSSSKGEPSEKHNRRNDASRNWGLHE